MTTYDALVEGICHALWNSETDELSAKTLRAKAGVRGYREGLFFALSMALARTPDCGVNCYNTRDKAAAERFYNKYKTNRTLQGNT